jgi:Golgi apparatus protein 1
MSLLHLNLSALAAVLALSVTAPPRAIAQSNPCSEDIARFCAEVDPGDGRLSSCLGEDHVDEISEACRSHLKQTFLRTQILDLDDDCLDAAQHQCFDAVLLGHDFENCLREGRQELSANCRKAVEE